MSTQIKPVTFMLASTFNLSISAVLAKFLSESISLELLNFLRFIMPAIVMLWLMSLTKWEAPSKRELPPLLLRALFITVTQLCFLYAISFLSLIEAVVLFSTGPLFIPLLEKLIFGSPVKGITLVALVLAFCGVLIQGGYIQGVDWRPELLIGLGSGLANALAQVCMFRASKSQLSPLALNTWCMVFAAVIAVPIFLITTNSGENQLANISDQTLVLAGLFLLTVTVINTQVFRIKAYRLVESGGRLAPLIFTNLIFAFLWQQLFFEQALEIHKLVGISMITAAMLINTFAPKLAIRNSLSLATCAAARKD